MQCQHWPLKFLKIKKEKKSWWADLFLYLEVLYIQMWSDLQLEMSCYLSMKQLFVS